MTSCPSSLLLKVLTWVPSSSYWPPIRRRWQITFDRILILFKISPDESLYNIAYLLWGYRSTWLDVYYQLWTWQAEWHSFSIFWIALIPQYQLFCPFGISLATGSSSSVESGFPPAVAAGWPIQDRLLTGHHRLNCWASWGTSVTLNTRGNKTQFGENLGKNNISKSKRSTCSTAWICWTL